MQKVYVVYLNDDEKIGVYTTKEKSIDAIKCNYRKWVDDNENIKVEIMEEYGNIENYINETFKGEELKMIMRDIHEISLDEIELFKI